MERTNYEVRVGLFALFALILLVWGWAWLKSFSLFSQPQRFTAQFSDVAGLSRSAPVNVQGVRVGTVDYIEFVNNQQQPEHNRKINVHIKITDSSIVVPEGAHISIQTLGLVGAKYIEIMLPKDAAGNIIGGRPLTADDVVVPPAVEEPVRVELVVNRVASKVDDIVSSVDTQQAAKAIDNLSQATAKLNKNMDQFKQAAVSVTKASDQISATAGKFGRVADNATTATERAGTFFADGDKTMRNVSELAADARGTTHKLNKLLDNPNISSDLKETMAQARQTAETIRATMSELSNTLKDKDLREQVLSSLTHLETATNNIHSSLETLSKLAGDKELRGDVKYIVQNAKEAMHLASSILNQPDVKGNFCATLNKIHAAADNVDVAARQLQEIMSKRAPLLQMMFGRPGKVPPKQPDNPACPPKKSGFSLFHHSGNTTTTVPMSVPTTVPAPAPGRP
jgi:phospholipid/cholesterol/gamma-HCH transport system substrate-binding protein